MSGSTGRTNRSMARAPYPGAINNPGNLRPGGIEYSGQTGFMTAKDGGRFIMFDTPQNGLNAMARSISQIARTKIPERFNQERISDDRFTPRTLVEVYAPSDDSNDVGGYTDFVAKRLGVGPSDELDISDEVQMAKLLDAMVRRDSGHRHADWFTADEYRNAARAMRQDAKGGDAVHAADGAGMSTLPPGRTGRTVRGWDRLTPEGKAMSASGYEVPGSSLVRDAQNDWGGVSSWDKVPWEDGDYWDSPQAGDDMTRLTAGEMMKLLPAMAAPEAGLAEAAAAMFPASTAGSMIKGEGLGKSVAEGAKDAAVTYAMGKIPEKLLSMTGSGIKTLTGSIAESDRLVSDAKVNLLREMLRYKARHSGKTSAAAKDYFTRELSRISDQPRVTRLVRPREVPKTNVLGGIPKTNGPLKESAEKKTVQPMGVTQVASKPAITELDALIAEGDPNVIQYGKNVDELLKWVPPKPVFNGPARSGAMPAVSDEVKNAWLADIRNRYGTVAANNAEELLRDPGMPGFFYPDGYADLAAKYTKMKGMFNTIAVPNEITLGGSPGIASEGTLLRSVAAPHDLDFVSNVAGASKLPHGSVSVEDQLMRLSDRAAIEKSPVFRHLREKYPELKDAKFRHADYDYQFDRGPNGAYDGDLRYDPNFFTVPMVKPSVSKDGRANRLVTVRIGGEKVDIMLSDEALPISRSDPRFGSADGAMAWKKSYASHGKPREKDLPDITGYNEYGEDNLMIDPFTGQSQFSSMMFPEDSYILENGLPRVVEMPLRPGHDLKVPVIMNDRGELLNLMKPGPVVTRYDPSHKMYEYPSLGMDADTAPVVAIRGSELSADAPGEAAGSIGFYPAKDVDNLVDGMLTKRPFNWVSKPDGFKDVLIYPRATVDPRYNPRNAIWDVDAYTSYGPETPPGLTAREVRSNAEQWVQEDSVMRSTFPYGSPRPNYPEFNAGFRASLYKKNPESLFSGDPRLHRYRGYGEGKSELFIPKENYIRIPGSLLENEPEKARAVLKAVIERMKFAAPVAAAGGLGYGAGGED